MMMLLFFKSCQIRNNYAKSCINHIDIINFTKLISYEGASLPKIESNPVFIKVPSHKFWVEYILKFDFIDI